MRLKILSDDEIQAVYGNPRFTEEERSEYFATSVAERAALAQLRAVSAKTGSRCQRVEEPDGIGY